MLSDDLTLKLYEFKSYLPIFIQWNPVTNVPVFPPPSAVVADGALYEITCDADLIINDIRFNLRKHDLIVRVDGKWEHVDMMERNRLRFEAWINKHKKGPNKIIYNKDENIYKGVTLQNKWEVWQAAIGTCISG